MLIQVNDQELATVQGGNQENNMSYPGISRLPIPNLPRRITIRDEPGGLDNPKDINDLYSRNSASQP